MHDRRHGEDFGAKIGEQERRMAKARREKRHGMWFGLGMFGIVGWSVAVPALALMALGIWIDRHFPGAYSWTLMLLLIGIVIGCLNAWYWINIMRKENNHE